MTIPSEVDIVVSSDRPEFAADAMALDSVWPMFMLQDPQSERLLEHISELADWLFYVVDRTTDKLVGRIVSVPWSWPFPSEQLPARGWDAAIDLAIQCVTRSERPTDACALEITLHPSVAGRGLSAVCLTALREVAAERGCQRLFAPVRPTTKTDAQRVPMRDFIRRRRPDGELEDPWLRVHERLGASTVGVAPLSMTVTGTLDEWRSWTGLAFDGDEASVEVPGGLVPVLVDRHEGVGCYVEPNVWMCHALQTPADPGA